MSVVLTESVIQPQRTNLLNPINEINIRPAHLDDVKVLGELWYAQRDYHKQWDELYENVATAQDDWVSQLINWIPEKNHGVFVAEDNHEQLLGYVHGSFYPWPNSPYGVYGSLNTISVAEEARGQGVGKKLVKKLLEWFKDHQISHISVHVDYRNQRALHIYQSVGFRPYQYMLMLDLAVAPEFSLPANV